MSEEANDNLEGSAAVPESATDDALRELMQRNYMEWASYVVRDRAIPALEDGLKPVQRRILHTLFTMDDGRMHKVNNVVGAVMPFHPHGDASIYEALIVLANKGVVKDGTTSFFIDRGGSYGNIIIGAPAAAGRYIECRLSKFGREVLFNPEITDYVPTYDGRAQEPVRLPAKVPVLLMLGSTGIAAGMAPHIFPHNFAELLQAEIAILKGEPFQVLPDYITGGLMDASEYDDGRGFIQVRARLENENDKKIVITEVPAETTTEALIASIENAARNGKIKISGITDLTSETARIEISLPRGVYAEETIQGLYAYTRCEQKLYSSLLVIDGRLPVEMSVSDVLRANVKKLQEYLRRELELALFHQTELLHTRTLERIFIEERIYKRIEKAPTMEKIVATVRAGLKPFRAELQRDVSDEDIQHLLAIPIRRISLFDIQKNQQELDRIRGEIEKYKGLLAHQVEYAIDYLQGLYDRYGALYPRRTEITSFTAVDRREIARRDLKVWHDRVGGFIGTRVKPSNKNDSALECTEFDRLLVLRTDGTCVVMAVEEKSYVGQAKYVFLYNKDQVFSVLYHDKKAGTWYAKRFQIESYILGKEYHVAPEGCQIDALYTEPTAVELELPVNRRRSFNSIKVDFERLPLRSREARGFKLTSLQVLGFKTIDRSEVPPDDPPEAEAAPPAPPASGDGAGGGNGPGERPKGEPLHQPNLPFFL